MNGDSFNSIVVMSVLLLRVAGCSAAELIDSTLERAHRKSLLLAGSLVAGLVIANWFAGALVGNDGMRLVATAIVVYRYVAYPAILALFLSVMNTPEKMRAVWTLVAVDAMLYCTAFFCPLTFSLANGNQLQRGPLGFVAQVLCALFIAQMVYLTKRQPRREHSISSLLPVYAAALIVVSVTLDALLGFDYRTWFQITTMTNPLACDLVFLWLHWRIARELEQARLERQRTQLAISQIQPHFLYNTLTTIQSLCTVDPERAARTTEKFATYLRQNLDTLSQAGLIPFSKELEHTRTYAQIETTRFPNIEVTYDIKSTDFMLPALSVQPLVENAIRHGVRIRDRGIVRVRSYAKRGFHIVEVRDNGKGFDVETLATQDTDEHIGIYNVRQRIRSMCGGELKITSVVGEGTRVSLLVPTEEDPK